ncbi:MAG: hypothetical protein HY814_09195 [Candidatus Riflebacteria bacterium]|nr:hypothetical protein [Candidatus Riflebacteria bacterium]
MSQGTASGPADPGGLEALWPGLLAEIWQWSGCAAMLALVAMLLAGEATAMRACGLVVGWAVGVGLLVQLGREVGRRVEGARQGRRPRVALRLALVKYPILFVVLYPFFVWELTDPFFFLGGFVLVHVVFLYRIVDTVRRVGQNPAEESGPESPVPRM